SCPRAADSVVLASTVPGFGEHSCSSEPDLRLSASGVRMHESPHPRLASASGMTVGNAGPKTRARRVVGVPRRARTSAGIRPGHTDAFIFGGHDIGVVSAPTLIDIEVEGLRQVVEGHVRTGEVHEGDRKSDV